MKLRKVIEKIKPTKEETRAITKIAEGIIKKLRKKTSCEIVLAGSVAKGTFLRGEGDIDIFVLFKKKMEKNRMKEILEKLFKKAFPGLSYQMNYAEHPYIRFHYEGKRVDLVPAYKMAAGERLLTAVDRSVLHTKFIKKTLKKKDEVLLLKKFLKTQGLYGAEIKTEGFSGYLCELLIVKYKTFANLMRAAAGWKFPVIIDIKRYYKKSEYEELIKRFNKSLIVIDPTDKNRNVAAPVSEENIKRFKLLARRFIKKPSEDYFFKQKSFEEKIKEMKNPLIIRFDKPNVVDDILWGQTKKLMSTLERELQEYEVKKIIADSDEKQITIAIATKKKTIGGKIEIKGPPVSMKEHVKKFKETHKNAKFFEKDGFVFAVEKKKKENLKDRVKDLIKREANRFTHLRPFLALCFLEGKKAREPKNPEVNLR